MRKILNFASIEAKKFSLSFCLEAKITKSKRSEKLKRKKQKKAKKAKKAKKVKKYTWILLRFVSLRSENYLSEAKRKIWSEKIEVKFYSEQAKHKWNGSNSLLSEKFFLAKRAQCSRNQGFSYYFCLVIEGSGSGSIPLTNGSRSGSRWPKNIWIRIQIRNTYYTDSTTLLRLDLLHTVSITW